MSEGSRLAAVTPSARQIMLQKMGFYAFVHFGLSTFYDREWGLPDYELSRFAPDRLDTAQWVCAAKSAGMRGIILTCKHHDGFCLWNTRQTDFQVMNTPLGRDIALELSRECEKEGLRFGVYLSPWDMREQTYGQGEAYNDFYVAQLTELLTGYGDIFAVWLDGACGEGKNGKIQRYDWQRYYDTVRCLRPEAVISVTGPDVRWCGNEAGHCRESEFSVVPTRLADPELIADSSQRTEEDAVRLRAITRRDPDLGSRAALSGERDIIWYPAEVDVSIRPGWFYHTAEDEKVKSADALWDIYCGSVGGNATLLLNLPPDRHGLIHPADCKSLRELGERIERVFAQSTASDVTASAEDEHHPASAMLVEDESFFMPPGGCEEVRVRIALDRPRQIRYAVIMEQIACGQRIEQFELWANGGCIYHGTTVGYKKICRVAPVTASVVELVVLCSRTAPTIRYFGLYEEA